MYDANHIQYLTVYSENKKPDIHQVKIVISTASLTTGSVVSE